MPGFFFAYILYVPGGYSRGVTPVPIPNTEVKSSSADGTAYSFCGRVSRCRDCLNELSYRQLVFYYHFIVDCIHDIKMKNIVDKLDEITYYIKQQIFYKSNR